MWTIAFGIVLGLILWSLLPFAIEIISTKTFWKIVGIIIFLVILYFVDQADKADKTYKANMRAMEKTYTKPYISPSPSPTPTPYTENQQYFTQPENDSPVAAPCDSVKFLQGGCD